jgi:prefoldin subunit 5
LSFDFFAKNGYTYCFKGGYMTLKIDSQFQSLMAQKHDSNVDVAQVKRQLIEMLNDFPYESVNLETDHHITEALDLIQDDIDFDRSSVIVSKDKLIEALLCEKCATEKQEPLKNHMNPAMSALSYFDLVAQNKEREKAAQFQKFQEISSDLDKLSQAMSVFQTSSNGEKIDLSANPNAKAIIDSVRQKWGLPQGSGPYAWDNKNDVIAFLTQKQKELTHRSQEVMLNLQHHADQLKSMVDATKEMIKANNDLCEYINRKTAGG